METKISSMNTTALAYVGDAVYELKIRELLLAKSRPDIDRIHREAVRYVSSEGQARAVKALMNGFLTEEETRLVKRARNKRATSRPRNADPRNYKLATGFEALLGYLYLAKEEQRLEEVMREAIKRTEETKDE